MRTIDAMPKQKQIEKAKETLEIYAPIAHRLGIHAIKWELEDLAFAALHPRKYQEIKGLVNQQREEREDYVKSAGDELSRELEALGIAARISGRAKHFYSIYSKMTKKGREFNEIYDLTAMRVVVDSVKDCYGAVGVIHSLWKPLPGRFKDFVAMPKFNMYQSLHTTVIGPEGLPLEIQIRTKDMHDMAEFGVAAHWMYKQDVGKRAGGPEGDDKLKWLRSMLDWQQELRVDLFDEEVFVFTPKGEVKSLAQGATPLDFAYEVHTEVGHRCVGAKVNGKIVPLNYALSSGDIVEILTSKRDRGPSRDWLALVKTTRARNKIKQFFKAESREDTEHSGRELLQEHLKKQGLPPQKIVSSPLLADVIREMGFRKADDFYIALGGAKISAKVVVNKVMQRLKQGEAAEQDNDPAQELVSTRRARRQPTGKAGSYGIRVDGVRARPLGGRPSDRVPRRAPGRRLGPPPAPGGPVAHVRRGRVQHRRGALHRQLADGPEPLRRRGARHPGPQAGRPAPAQHRRRLRRLPHHSGRELAQAGSAGRPPAPDGRRRASRA
jgi:GTP pyrophosphokinase